MQISVNENSVDIPAGLDEEGRYLRLYSINFIVTEDMACAAHIAVLYTGNTAIWAMVDEFHLAYKGTSSEIMTGINASATPSAPATVCSLSGIRLATPQQGINIIRNADGTTRKVRL